MSFVDSVTVTVQAGDGGHGKLGWRREKFISKGGPDGGDGGHGGNVVLVASRNQDTLARFRFEKEVKAQPGQPGGSSNKHGRSGQDLLVQVPVGTIATGPEGILADLTEDGQEAVVARGGRGGFGNAHFLSSTRQAPNFAEKGEPGERRDLKLELKMIADVGLIGLPNAGKSTLLSRISNARPEIANYPFTTLVPNLGMAPVDKDIALLVADIPGLIEGAAEGKGLGHDFLRHVERTAVLLHLVDAYSNHPAADYKAIRAELAAYSPELAGRPEIAVLNKIDGLDDEIVADIAGQLQKAAGKNTPVMSISAAAGTGLRPLLYAAAKLVHEQRALAAAAAAESESALPVITLPDNAAAWRVERLGPKTFMVTGRKIEKFAQRTEFTNDEAVQRLRDILRKMGVMHKLERDGIEAGNTIKIAGVGKLKY